ncbi:hypothetical protein AX774_g4941, partial [Zancudomyces culisetae]
MSYDNNRGWENGGQYSNNYNSGPYMPHPSYGGEVFDQDGSNAYNSGSNSNTRGLEQADNTYQDESEYGSNNRHEQRPPHFPRNHSHHRGIQNQFEMEDSSISQRSSQSGQEGGVGFPSVSKKYEDNGPSGGYERAPASQASLGAYGESSPYQGIPGGYGGGPGPQGGYGGGSGPRPQGPQGGYGSNHSPSPGP